MEQTLKDEKLKKNTRIEKNGEKIENLPKAMASKNNSQPKKLPDAGPQDGSCDHAALQLVTSMRGITNILKGKIPR